MTDRHIRLNKKLIRKQLYNRSPKTNYTAQNNASSYVLKPAGFWIRFWAYIVDLLDLTSSVCSID